MQSHPEEPSIEFGLKWLPLGENHHEVQMRRKTINSPNIQIGHKAPWEKQYSPISLGNLAEYLNKIKGAKFNSR